MLVYIIDAFNLIHKVASLKNSNTPHCDLIYYIKKNKLTGSNNNKVIIVFDGNVNLQVKREEGRFEVLFSGKESADEIIKRRISKIRNKSETIVVSDDREIKDAAKRERTRLCSISDFIKTKKKEQAMEKEISYTVQKEITEELRKIWLGE